VSAACLEGVQLKVVVLLLAAGVAHVLKRRTRVVSVFPSETSEKRPRRLMSSRIWVSPGPMPLARRMACGGPGGVGCSVGRKKGGWLWMTETPRDSTVILTSPEKRDAPWQDTTWR
jgi:hypothetical protein